MNAIPEGYAMGLSNDERVIIVNEVTFHSSVPNSLYFGTNMLRVVVGVESSIHTVMVLAVSLLPR